MAQPIYRYEHVAGRPQLAADAHVGLWFNRFYNAFEADWKVGEEGKSSWVKQVAGKRGNEAELTRLAARMQRLAGSLGAECDDFATQWHFATGLGISHPVENGFTWHHTLGLPYLPASSVKGLLRGWVEVWMEHADKENKKELIARWFGASASDQEGSVGGLIFFDALPIEPVVLACDVMTPHMGKWYANGVDITEQSYATTAPSDWHSPVPVPFLVVSKAKFRFTIAPRQTGNPDDDSQARADASEAMRQLADALLYAGAGAKTATGYGRMQSEKQAAQLKAEQDKLELMSKGISMESVVWNGAKATLNKSSQTLIITFEGNEVKASGDFGKQLIQGLSEAAQKRLKDGKKPLLLNATIDCKGNNKTIISIEEIAP